MIISHKINQHLDRNEEHLVEAVQGDSGRELVMNLYHQNAMWTPPEDTMALIRFAGSNGFGGCYDTMPDGTAAWSISGSVLTVRLAPQVLATPGITRVQVLLMDAQASVATFSVLIRVQVDPSAEAMEAEDYVNLSRWIGEEVAKQVTDAVAPPAVFKTTLSEGCLDCEFVDMEDAWQRNQGMCCVYEGTILWVQRIVPGSCCVFSGIRGEELITVTVDQDGAVTVDTGSLKDSNSIRTHKVLRPAFAWIDDDGKEKVGHLFQWAKTNSVPFTAALITGNVGQSGWLSTQQLAMLHDSGLVSFASHTQNHVKLTDVTGDTVEAELKNSKAQIESWGYPCAGIVYPEGAVKEADIQRVNRYYSLGFVDGGTYGDGNIPNSNRVNTCPISTYQLMRVAIRGDYTEENGGLPYLRAQVDNAIASNGLLVFMSHIGSTADGAGGYLTPGADLEVYSYIVGYIREKGYDIEPLAEACQRFENPLEAGKLCIGADGSVSVPKGNVHIMAAHNTYTCATPPSKYPKNQITSCQIYDTTAPSNMGILTAYVTDSLAYRTFMPQSKNKLYLQIRSSTSDSWLGWDLCNQKDFAKLNNNVVLSTTLPSALAAGVSVSIVSSAADYVNLPEGVMGTMTVYHLYAGADKAREEWQPNGSANKYVRYATSTSAWGPWYVLTPTLYQA